MKRTSIPKEIQDQLPKCCCNCSSDKDLVYHHIVPVRLGGKNIASNIAVVCSDCHSRIHFGKKGSIDHGDLVRRGIKDAKERGVLCGKPPADYEHIMMLIARHSTQFNDIYDINYELHTEHEIMEMAGVKEVCYAKCKRMLKNDMKSSEWKHDWPKPKVFKRMPMYDAQIKRLREVAQ